MGSFTPEKKSMVYVKVADPMPPEAFVDRVKKVRVERVGVIQVSATVDKEKYGYVMERRATENGWGWSDLIDTGIGAKTAPDVLKERIDKLEAELNARTLKMRKLLPTNKEWARGVCE